MYFICTCLNVLFGLMSFQQYFRSTMIQQFWDAIPIHYKLQVINKFSTSWGEVLGEYTVASVEVWHLQFELFQQAMERKKYKYNKQ